MLTNQDAPTLWTSREAAKALAISQRKLWDLTNRNIIPRVLIGRSVRYDPQDIRAYIDAQKSSNAPEESQAEDP
jgi:predicted DNA-binding transcriptional regulator AlpA